jgi:hypothetical protein
MGRSRKAIGRFSAHPQLHEKTLENKAISHFSAYCRNVPKRSETRPAGSKYYRSVLPHSPEEANRGKATPGESVGTSWCVAYRVWAVRPVEGSGRAYRPLE